MLKVGDQVRITIRGQTALSGTATTITLGEGASIEVPGKIIEDKGTHWLVEVSMSFGGKNRILVPKEGYKGDQ